jgi:site-specific DNA-methyltransferase (adenine-specific)
MNTKQITAGDNFTLHLGDNLATLKAYPDNTFDSIVTDPPYGIDFLGKKWDSHTGTVELYKECLRVLKPGGYLLAFSAARTYHKLAYSVELAGFEIRDQLMWLYSSGFPKAQDIGKAIQKRLGVKETVAHKYNKPGVANSNDVFYTENPQQTVCTDDIAKEWEGFKTALKPAHEPIVMARKPFKGSTIDNVLKNGLGAMNIDATRVPWVDDQPKPQPLNGNGGVIFQGTGYIPADEDAEMSVVSDAGRYPSNVIGEVAEGYQKYFYCPKVSRKERHSGFEKEIEGIRFAPEPKDGCAAIIEGHEDQRCGDAKITIGNNHPTVKPVALMEYLIKLVTPPSTPTLQRKVLDPFNGSGSTGMAATKLGHYYTGCELDPKYIAISEKRIEAWNAPEPEDNPLPDDLFGDI